MKKVLTFLFAFAMIGTLAFAQSDAVVDPRISALDTRVNQEVQNLDARINMDTQQEEHAFIAIKAAALDYFNKAQELSEDKDALVDYKQQRITQAITELKPHLSATQYQKALDYGEERGFQL